MNPDWPGMMKPDWPAPPGVCAVFTTRHGGRSQPPFATFNLGDHVGDAAADVAANRAALQAATGSRCVFLRQIHGADVTQLHAGSADGQSADACLTGAAGVACTIMVADCLPLLFATSDGAWVGAAHAGWRGLAGSAAASHAHRHGVLEALHADFLKAFDAANQSGRAQAAPKIIAWLGPCIGPQAFEVGPEVKTAFEAGAPASAACFVPLAGGKFLADLPALARLRLQALGVHDIYGNDSSVAWCTASNPSQYFSHRRDAAAVGGNGAGTTGRMAACVWRE